MSKKSIYFSGIDWLLVLIYVTLVAIGGLMIYSAVYDAESVGLPARFVNQLVWFGLSITVGWVILLVDSKYWYNLSYVGYIVMLALLIGVGLFAPEIKGARSWISLGGFTVQPAEFMKIITALAISRFMSSYTFDFRNVADFFKVCVILGLPMGIIMILQNDTGSSLVFASFLFMLYREGLNRFFYIILISLITIFISYFLLNSFAFLLLLVIILLVISSVYSGEWRDKIRYGAILAGVFIILSLIFYREGDIAGTSLTTLFMVSLGLTMPLVIFYVIRKPSHLQYVIYFVCSIVYFFSVRYVFENIIQLHQQKRILILLGVESDIFGWGYNVNQSKIAIGSGGLWGKGFLNGTQTKFNFVPEQSTDFIFCTVGEEFGFFGAAIILLLFLALILRIIKIGESVQDPFSRIFCYCVASVFLFHLMINVGMTIGIMPVIGIPLPFFSYGGSSLLAFSVMIALVLKLSKDSYEKGNNINHYL